MPPCNPLIPFLYSNSNRGAIICTFLLGGDSKGLAQVLQLSSSTSTGEEDRTVILLTQPNALKRVLATCPGLTAPGCCPQASASSRMHHLSAPIDLYTNAVAPIHILLLELKESLNSYERFSSMILSHLSIKIMKSP
jgi:hypothetical protein